MSTRSPELADIIKQAIEDRLVDVHTMLPGRIDAYDSATQKADVEPLIKRLQKTVDGEIREDLPVIPGVPVLWPRAGGFKLTMPVSEGDRCMLVFCERSIETYQTGQGRKGTSALINQTDPDTFEMHNLSDPVALMGWYNDAESLSDTDADGMQLGKDGGAIIHIGADLVELYEKSGAQADFVALAAKVKAELDKIAQDINILKSIFAAWTPVPQDGGAALKLLLPPRPTQTISINPVAADKVKAT